MRENFGSVPVCGWKCATTTTQRFRSYRSYKGSGTAFYIGIRSTVVGETTARGMYAELQCLFVLGIFVFVFFVFFFSLSFPFLFFFPPLPFVPV